jgi:hypothetical protein
MSVARMISVRCIRAISFVVRRSFCDTLCKLATMCDLSSVLDAKVAVQPFTEHNDK